MPQRWSIPKIKNNQGKDYHQFLDMFLIQAGQFSREKWDWTLLDLPFPPCVALTVQTENQQDKQDRHRLETGDWNVQ